MISANIKPTVWPRYYEDSPDEFDPNFKSDGVMRNTRGGSRVIVLGDGTEIDSDSVVDAEMIDDEDKDEEELEKKKATAPKVKEESKPEKALKESTEETSNGTSEVKVPDGSPR